MLSVKARKVADTIFKVFGMTQLRTILSLPRFAGERSNHKATKLVLSFMFVLSLKNSFKWVKCMLFVVIIAGGFEYIFKFFINHKLQS